MKDQFNKDDFDLELLPHRRENIATVVSLNPLELELDYSRARLPCEKDLDDPILSFEGFEDELKGFGVGDKLRINFETFFPHPYKRSVGDGKIEWDVNKVTRVFRVLPFEPRLSDDLLASFSIPESRSPLSCNSILVVTSCDPLRVKLWGDEDDGVLDIDLSAFKAEFENVKVDDCFNMYAEFLPKADGGRQLAEIFLIEFIPPPEKEREYDEEKLARELAAMPSISIDDI